MFEPTAMIMADRATRRHARSGQPAARTAPEPPPRPGYAARRLTVAGLRRLADRLEPHAVTPSWEGSR
jgi:hypothetical protein